MVVALAAVAVKQRIRLTTAPLCLCLCEATERVLSSGAVPSAHSRAAITLSLPVTDDEQYFVSPHLSPFLFQLLFLSRLIETALFVFTSSSMFGNNLSCLIVTET